MKSPKVTLDKMSGTDARPEVQYWMDAFHYGAASLMNLLTAFELHIETGMDMGYEFRNEAGLPYATAQDVADAVRRGAVVSIEVPNFEISPGDLQ